MSTRKHMICPTPAQHLPNTCPTLAIPPLSDLPNLPIPHTPVYRVWVGKGGSRNRTTGNVRKHMTCPILGTSSGASGSTQTNGTLAHVIRRGNQSHALDALLCLLPYASKGTCSTLDNRAHGPFHASAVHGALTPPQSADWDTGAPPPVRFFPIHQPQDPLRRGLAEIVTNEQFPTVGTKHAGN